MDTLDKLAGLLEKFRKIDEPRRQDDYEYILGEQKKQFAETFKHDADEEKLAELQRKAEEEAGVLQKERFDDYVKLRQ
jgi:hypothetical protein